MQNNILELHPLCLLGNAGNGSENDLRTLAVPLVTILAVTAERCKGNLHSVLRSLVLANDGGNLASLIEATLCTLTLWVDDSRVTKVMHSLAVCTCTLFEVNGDALLQHNDNRQESLHVVVDDCRRALIRISALLASAFSMRTQRSSGSGGGLLRSDGVYAVLSARALNLIGRRLGASLLCYSSRSLSGRNLYVHWLSSAVRGIGSGTEKVRQQCYSLLQFLVPLVSLSKEVENHDLSNVTVHAADTPEEGIGALYHGDVLERLLSGQPVELLGTGGSDSALLRRLQDLTGFEPPQTVDCGNQSSGVNSDGKPRLRGYQWEAVSWMTALRRCGLGALLADDMGLGKTLQALVTLALMELERREGVDAEAGPIQVLILCPASLVPHWLSEIRKFFPPSLMLGVDYRGSVTGSVGRAGTHLTSKVGNVSI